ncbi:MAG: porin [Cyclobacteriaceae bacterium]|nr:porin [Cyclobacteriaceae bacterium]
MFELNCENMKNLWTFLLLLLCSNWASAQDGSDFSWSAYLDTYFAYDFNKPRSHDRQYSNMAARHNEFNINHAYFLGAFKNEDIRSEIGLQFGTYPDFNYAAEPSDFYRLIYKAYEGVKLGEGVWLDVGMFPGHTGYESVESLNNEIYRRALSTEYTPYYETGARITAELSEKVTLTGVVLNGWQNIGETNKSKALGMNFNYKISDAVELNYGNYFGNEGTRFTRSKYRVYNHFYLKHITSAKFHYMIGFDHGSQEPIASNQTEDFYFITLIAQYYFSPKFSVAGRVEQVDDSEQILISTNVIDGFVGQVYSINFIDLGT